MLLHCPLKFIHASKLLIILQYINLPFWGNLLKVWPEWNLPVLSWLISSCQSQRICIFYMSWIIFFSLRCCALDTARLLQNHMNRNMCHVMCRLHTSCSAGDIRVPSTLPTISMDLVLQSTECTLMLYQPIDKHPQCHAVKAPLWHRHVRLRRHIAVHCRHRYWDSVA